MSMIEVDPKLFITCRLCLEEMGQYQIVPKVQIQIKYCFEIDVQPFDGLPQLLCKKCESILSQYAGIKQMYQEKQNNFIEKMKKNAKNKVSEEVSEQPKEDTNNQQQQDTVSSTQHIDIVNKNTYTDKKALKKKKLSIKLSKKAPPADATASESESSDSKCNINELNSNNEDKTETPKNVTNKNNTAWTSDYNKYFVCKICSKSYKDKANVISHINKHENLVTMYSSILNSHIVIAMNKVGRIPNLTSTDKYVVCGKDKVIKSENALYYIVYNAKKAKRDRSSSDSSDEDLIRSKVKYKRQRLISEEDKTVVVKPTNENATLMDTEKQNVESDNDCDDQTADVNIDSASTESDSTSTQNNKHTAVDVAEPERKPPQKNKMSTSDVIAMCCNRYLKRYDDAKNSSKFQGNMESFLQHKVLSIGTKIIHNKGLNSTGLLRYLEHKNLNINWLQSKNSNCHIVVKTTLKNAKASANNNDNCGMKNITHYLQDYTKRDFVDIFENIPLEKELPKKDRKIDSPIIMPIKNNKENKVKKNKNPTANILSKTNKEIEYNVKDVILITRLNQDSDKQNCTKILNASPVANPKQLPIKKTVNEPPSTLKSPPRTSISMETSPSSDDVIFKDVPSRMPVITSTVSLASFSEEKRRKEDNSSSSVKKQDNGKETYVPRIKVKPVSELMPDKSLPKQKLPLATMTGWTGTSSQQQAPNTSMVYVANIPQYTCVSPQQSTVVCYPQIICSVSSNAINANESTAPSAFNNAVPRPMAQEQVNMNTVELPNTKTSSPFRYFQKLLQIHNIVLLDSTALISSMMKCLIKFTLGFHQENNAPVNLCLTLFCDRNIFCIKVRDMALNDLDVSKLSTNWQWEILKVFKGDIVSKLNINALKLGLDMSSKVNNFVTLLKSIGFSKVR